MTDLKPIYLGPKHQQLWENVFEPQMQAAESGKSTPQAAWDKAVKEFCRIAPHAAVAAAAGAAEGTAAG